jgi:hypothetical protein
MLLAMLASGATEWMRTNNNDFHYCGRTDFSSLSHVLILEMKPLADTMFGLVSIFKALVDYWNQILFYSSFIKSVPID